MKSTHTNGQIRLSNSGQKRTITGSTHIDCRGELEHSQHHGPTKKSQVVKHNPTHMEEALANFETVKRHTPDNAKPLGEFTLTAYTVGVGSTGKSPGSPGYGITYSGTKAVVERTVAVDPKVIPIGTPVYIEGIGWRLAEDTGGAVKGRHIDVLMDSDNRAVQFGVQRHIRVYCEDPQVVSVFQRGGAASQ